MKIFNIQRFCVNDGKGIRTTVFFRDCPLRCKWCANPESWADSASSEKEMSVPEIISEVSRDKEYYKNSGGGVTLSGGEPLLHIDEKLLLLEALKEKNFDVTVETCGNFPQSTLEKVLPYVNEFYFDIKHVNPQKLKDFTKGDALLILKNLKFLLQNGANVQVRIPIIPGFNYSDEDMTEIFNKLKSLGIKNIVLLPYHTLGSGKYAKLSIENPYKEYSQVLTKKDLEKYENLWDNISGA